MRNSRKFPVYVNGSKPQLHFSFADRKYQTVNQQLPYYIIFIISIQNTIVP